MAAPFLTKAIALVFAVALAARLMANELATDALQAAIAELGTTRLGVVWNRRDDEGARSIAARIATGLAVGALAAGVLFAIARAAGLRGSLGPTLAPVTLLLVLLQSSLGAVRDELLVRGLITRLLAPVHPAWTLVASAMASIAWSVGMAGDYGASVPELVASGLAGALFGGLWLRDRAAWMPIAAHAAFSFLTGGGDLGLSAGWASAAAVGAACACVSVWVFSASRENSATPEVLS